MKIKESDSERIWKEVKPFVCGVGSTPWEWMTYGKDIIEGGQEMYSEEKNVKITRSARLCIVYLHS
jgi:hypothetical protein